MEKRIRLIAVETPVSTESINTKFITMVYAIGSVKELPIDGVKVKRTIEYIVDEGDCYRIYISNETTTQVWLDIQKTNRVSKVEYIID